MHEFQVLRQLGSGSFGRVLKVRRKEDMGIFAMKTVKLMQLNAKEKQNALNEVRLLASIDCPNVIKYKEAFYQECGNVLSIVMEFADGGDLAGLIQKKANRGERFEQNFIWKVAQDILRGLKFLHNSNIIHRDIKSANVFFAAGVAKLGDLNVSKVMEGNFATTQTGTPYYTPPEIWLSKKYTTTCDIWSLGCLLYELCCLRPPFMAKDFPGLSKKVTCGYYDPIPSRYSKKLSTLIRRCLTVDHLRRPTSTQLLQFDIFTMMQQSQDGEIELLDTIRCPRVLKMLNNQLPESQYEQKKPKTLKLIAQQNTRNPSSHNYPSSKSLKKIGSEKNIQAYSIDKNRYVEQRQNYHPSMKPYQEQYRNIGHNAVMQSPGGYVKLPQIPSSKKLY